MRFDWAVSQKDTVTFDGKVTQGEFAMYSATSSPLPPWPAQDDSSGVVKGGHMLGEWKHTFNDRSNSDLLGYCDWTDPG